MNKSLYFSLLLSIMLFLPLFVFGQEERKFGLSASLQGTQLGILVPVWLGSNFTLAPALDFKYAEKVGLDFSIGIVPKLYFDTEGIAPFVAARFGAAFYNPTESNSYGEEKKKSTDLIGGVGFGAEYFFNPHFSAGVEAQGNFTKAGENSTRFGNPGAFAFNTATMATINIFF